MVALAVPVVLSELGWMAQGVVDTIMVGKLGPAAIGAVAVGNAVYYTPSLFGIGLLLGLDTLVSHAFGRKDHEACHRWLAQGVYLACIVTPPLMVLIAAASYGLARAGVTPEVAGPAGSYLRILNFGTLPLLLYGPRGYLQEGGRATADRFDLRAGQPAELVRQLRLSSKSGRRRWESTPGGVNLRGGSMAVALIGLASRTASATRPPAF